MYILERSQWFPRSVDEVFPFFADATNLEAMTPSFLKFRVLTPAPISMSDGTLIDYRLSFAGVPFGWQTRIEEWRPMSYFVDTSLKGPYKRWHHRHEFVSENGGTRMTDRVEYQLPLGLLGNVAHALFVKASLRSIFDHRASVMAAKFGT